jgi:uncharacterized protein YndB with AHSA1/START domain
MSKKSKASSAKKSNTKKAVKPKASKKTAKPAKKSAKKVVSNKKPSVKKKVVAKKVASKKSEAPKKPVVKVTKVKAVKEKPVKKEKLQKVKIEKPIKLVEQTKKTLPTLVKKSESKSKAEVIIEDDEIEASSKKKNDNKTQSNEVLAISNTIPKTEAKPLSASKIASISSSITNPVKKIDSYSIKVEKEPTGKYELEFVVRSSPEMLFEFLSAPSGLSEWFCDDVNIRNGIYTFIWDGQLQQARLLKTIDNQLVRFQWIEKTDGSYFEFKIQRDDLTNDISLIITDFADLSSERESSKRLWQSQVEKLMQIIGSIF